MSITAQQRLGSYSDQLRESLDVNLYFFGGCVLDICINPSVDLRDIDVGIEGADELLPALAEKLRRNQFRIIDPHRSYKINMHTPVSMVFAKKDGMVYDISVLENMSDIGQFDIESMIWNGQSKEFEDRHKALDAHRKKKIQALHGLDKENPYLLLNRIVNLCAKYDIPLARGNQREMVEELLAKLVTWDHEDGFHTIECKTAFYSTLLKALLRADNRTEFAHSARQLGIFSQLFEELDSDDNFAHLLKALKRTNTKVDLVHVLISQSSASIGSKIRSRLACLKLRSWDEGDIATSSIMR